MIEKDKSKEISVQLPGTFEKFVVKTLSGEVYNYVATIQLFRSENKNFLDMSKIITILPAFIIINKTKQDLIIYSDKKDNDNTID
jgi:hypothetical protein